MSAPPAAAVEIRSLTYADLPQVVGIERRAFTTPWSLAMFVLELSKPSGICLAAEAATRARHGSGRLTRYGAELVVPREARLECAVLKAVADRYVMQRAEQERLRADQRIVVAELAEALTARAPDGLDPQFRALFEQAGDDRARKRVIVDQIGSLTDASARSLHARLTGHP